MFCKFFSIFLGVATTENPPTGRLRKGLNFRPIRKRADPQRHPEKLPPTGSTRNHAATIKARCQCSFEAEAKEHRPTCKYNIYVRMSHSFQDQSNHLYHSSLYV
jgi:hypothetical protein